MLVPMKTRPPEITGVLCVSVPIFARQRILVPDCRSNVAGRFVSAEVWLRDHASPHCGRSAADAKEISERDAARIEVLRVYCMESGGSLATDWHG